MTDGGLARHSTECTLGIDWDQSKIVGQEQDTTRRKMLERVETIKGKYKGLIPLYSYNQMEQWQIYYTLLPSELLLIV